MKVWRFYILGVKIWGSWGFGSFMMGLELRGVEVEGLDGLQVCGRRGCRLSRRWLRPWVMKERRVEGGWTSGV